MSSESWMDELAEHRFATHQSSFGDKCVCGWTSHDVPHSTHQGQMLVAAGYAVVQLPEPNEHPQIVGNREWPVDSRGMPGVKVVIRASDGRIASDGVSNPYQTAAEARSHAAALLAAALELESKQL